MEDRPRFIPKRKRNYKQQQQQQQERFHGAFTGGFSAGYYNTVGSKEGWKPRSSSRRRSSSTATGTGTGTGTTLVATTANDETNTTNEHDDDNNTYKYNYDTTDDERDIEARSFSPVPSTQSISRTQQQQRLEDFMDEQDYEEWGGPTNVKQEYNNKNVSSAGLGSSVSAGGGGGGGGDRNSSKSSNDLLAAKIMIQIEPPSNVGMRLLRVLGWRPDTNTNNNNSNNNSNNPMGGGFAYVPTTTTSTTTTTTNNSTTMDKKKKQIRKIKLQQQRVKIPPPKLDTCGLGYEPYQNAPEFLAMKQQRAKAAAAAASKRRKQTTTTTTAAAARRSNNNDVYCIDTILDGSKKNKQILQNNDNNDHDTNNNDDDDTDDDDDDDDAYYGSYETVQDFIGTKSVGGFALREDDDQVYDDENNNNNNNSNHNGITANHGTSGFLSIQSISAKNNTTTTTAAADAAAVSQSSQQHQQSKRKLDTDLYNTEIVEFSSDEDNDGTEHLHLGHNNNHNMSRRRKHQNNTNVIGSVLSNFANTKNSINKDNNNTTTDEKHHSSTRFIATGVTADGLPPLSGFVLGGSNNTDSISTSTSTTSVQKRFRGPDLPPNYEVQRHIFRDHEQPAVLQALSKATQLEALQQKKQQATNQALQTNATMNKPRNSTYHLQQQQQQQNQQQPMAGNTFAGLAHAMKNRFTSTKEDWSKSNMQHSGLRIPSKDTTATKNTTNINKTNVTARGDGNNRTIATTTISSNEKTKKIQISRTTHHFVPHRLLFKRFHVPIPAGSSTTTAIVSASGFNNTRVTEDSYFQQEIMSKTTGGTIKLKSGVIANDNHSNNSKSKNRASTVSNTLFHSDGSMKEVPTESDSLTMPLPPDRPSMQIYKSIFEPESENEKEDEEDQQQQQQQSDDTVVEGVKDSFTKLDPNILHGTMSTQNDEQVKASSSVTELEPPIQHPEVADNVVATSSSSRSRRDEKEIHQNVDIKKLKSNSGNKKAKSRKEKKHKRRFSAASSSDSESDSDSSTDLDDNRSDKSHSDDDNDDDGKRKKKRRRKHKHSRRKDKKKKKKKTKRSSRE